MKLKTRLLKKEIMLLMDQDGLSAEEIAIACGVSKVTIYKILNEQSEWTQRAIVRKIAAGMNRDFKITGEKVEFIKKAEQSSVLNDLSEEERKLLDVFNSLDKEERADILNFVESACKIVEKRRLRREKD